MRKHVSRFIVVGSVATIIHVLVATALIAFLGRGQVFGNVVAFLCATSFSYSANTEWTFSKRIEPRSLIRFFAASIVGTLLTSGISGFSAASGWHYLIGIAIIVLVVSPLMFIVHKYWTYSYETGAVQ